jgi:enolase-like protein
LADKSSDPLQTGITSLDGVRAIGAEARDKGFSALKTNVFIYDGGAPRGWRPGFGVPFMPELNVDKPVLRNLRAHLEAIRDGAGPNVDLLLDLNFNAKTEGYLKILRAIADIEMFWVEIDSYSPAALAHIRRRSPHPISSCETLLGLREFLPYFRGQAMDVAIVDAVWNGVWQSMKIAAAADAHEVNIAPHNFYGHLATMMNAHFAAATPNLRIMEIDIDRLPWDEELFTNAPQFEDGHLIVPDEPGWGTEPNEDALAPIRRGMGAACSIIVSRKRENGARSGATAGLRGERRDLSGGHCLVRFFRHTHLTAQCVAAARQARSHGSDGDAEDLGGGVVRHAFETDEQDYLSLFTRQPGERLLELAKLARGRRIRRRDE